MKKKQVRPLLLLLLEPHHDLHVIVRAKSLTASVDVYSCYIELIAEGSQLSRPPHSLSAPDRDPDETVFPSTSADFPCRRRSTTELSSVPRSPGGVLGLHESSCMLDIPHCRQADLPHSSKSACMCSVYVLSENSQTRRRRA